MLRVSVGGVSFDEWPRDFDHAFVIEPGGLTGWFESTSGRQNGGDRPTAHGSFDVPMLRSERAISISGNILASSEVELERMKIQLANLLGEGERGRLTVQSEAGTTWADVRQVNARPGPEYGTEATFLIQFVAADPRRYGEIQEFSGTSVTAFHRGASTATPTIRVTGSMPSGYRINGPGGRQFAVSQPLTSGVTHEIRMRNGWLYRNGVLQRGAGVVTRAQTWGIPAGVRVPMSLDPVSGSGQMTVVAPDTSM